MAKRANVQTKLVLTVVAGHSASGKAIEKARSFSNVNAALSDDDLLAVGQGLGGLQSYEVESVGRNDTAAIVAAEG